LEQRFEPPHALGRGHHGPESVERRGEPQGALRIGLEPPIESGPHIVELLTDESVLLLALGLEGEPRGFDELQEVVGVAPPETRCLAAIFQMLGRVLANRLEHPVALLGVAEEALFHERLQRVDVGRRDLFDRLERAAA
jgi:hypothetical protein